MNASLAPADARPLSPWPLWHKVAAYLFLIALAIASILFIDRGVMQSNPPRMQHVPNAPVEQE